MRLARRYLVTGRVQGGGFVEATAEGEADALERFERAISQGPRLARVDHVDITDIGATGHDGGFTIR